MSSSLQDRRHQKALLVALGRVLERGFTGQGVAADDPLRSGKYVSPAQSRVDTSLEISDLLTEVASEVHPPEMILGSRHYHGRFGMPRPLVVGLVAAVVGTLLLVLVAELGMLLLRRAKPSKASPSVPPATSKDTIRR